jgi:hypothetical protein
MRTALIVWPRLSTVRLVFWTLRLWFLCLCIPLVLLALPLFKADDFARGTPFPPYIQGLLAIGLTVVAGKVLDRFLGTSWLWGICDQLLAGGIAAHALSMPGKSFANLRPQRLRGDLTAWRTTMQDVELSLTATGALNSPAVRARDAAQRISPLALLALSLCAAELLGKWLWPKLAPFTYMRGVDLGFSLAMTWLVWGTVLGCCASLLVAPWIRNRCQ